MKITEEDSVRLHALQDKSKYDPSKIELVWQAKWEKEKIYQPDLDTATSHYYNLHMFPYPSAEGLHVGNVFAFTGADIYGRLRRMQGRKVFQPFGLDGFGIHSENYALKVGSHPMQQAEKSEKRFYEQVASLGSGYDWSHILETYDPDYYKWTQWLFTELFKAGLAYRAMSKVNWCPSCKTVLADEQVVVGQKHVGKTRPDTYGKEEGAETRVCERCGTEVEKRDMEQWFFRITTYAEELLSGLDKIDWTEKVKIAQRNWIGKSEGAQIKFSISNVKYPISSETIKFDPKLIALVLSKEKYITYRLEPKRLEEGEVFQLLNSKTGERFGLAKIIKLERRKLKEISENQEGHEKFTNRKEFYEVYQNYYKRDVNDETEVWLYYFELVDESIEVFTTRPDTLYGATFIVVSPEHPFVAQLRNSKLETQNSKFNEVEEYLQKARNKSERERQEIKEKTGVFSGAYALNPVSSEQIPIWIADYVLMGYGTGAIMAVPSHDERDFDFAKRYNLQIKQVVMPVSGENKKEVYMGPGKLINSGDWDGLKVPEQITEVITSLEQKGIGQRETNYHLRDWLISRQRYWGPPIPMIYCEHCAKEGKSWFSKEKISNFKFQISNSAEWDSAGWYPEENLPVLLPKIDDYRPLGTGKAPLANHPEFYKTTCPGCGKEARRETDVSDTFLDSSWYFLRYLATDLAHIPFPMSSEAAQRVISHTGVHKVSAIYDLSDSEGHDSRVSDSRRSQEDSSPSVQNDKGRNLTRLAAKRELEIRNSAKRVAWFPIDIYTGGAEHSVLHLLYARFIYKVLGDLGYIDKETAGDEPFPKFFAHGLIIKDGAKMSKSKGNVVVPDAYIKKYGADTLRMYLMFLGPFDQGGDFRDSGIAGMYRFLKRAWTLFTTQTIVSAVKQSPLSGTEAKLIKAVTEDIERFHYNTAIASIMIYYNYLSKQDRLFLQSAETFLKLLAPFAPHIAEELYQGIFATQKTDLQGFRSIHTSSWPKFDADLARDEKIVIVIQVNGKLRGSLIAANSGHAKQEIEKLAREQEGVKKNLEGKSVKKVIYVPGKILNFVVH